MSGRASQRERSGRSRPDSAERAVRSSESAKRRRRRVSSSCGRGGSVDWWGTGSTRVEVYLTRLGLQGFCKDFEAKKSTGSARGYQVKGGREGGRMVERENDGARRRLGSVA